MKDIERLKFIRSILISIIAIEYVIILMLLVIKLNVLNDKLKEQEKDLKQITIDCKILDQDINELKELQ